MLMRTAMVSFAALVLAGCTGSVTGGKSCPTCAADQSCDSNTGACVCTDPCTGSGPACDPSGTGQIGTCTLSATTGCYSVASLVACSGSGLTCVAGDTACTSGGNSHIVTLSWSAPTKNTDGSDLTDLAGYRLYQGTSTGAYGPSQDLGAASCAAGTCTHDVNGLATGTHYFAVTAVNAGGYESQQSNEASAVVP